MKGSKVSAILGLILGLMVLKVSVSEAAPMGTVFTYQGRLMDANGPANGVYDFQFELYDGPNTIDSNQIGNTIDINDLDVIDGYFTVELDFGSEVFDGDARWLEVNVRPGELADPNMYTVLEPPQEITPAPYALHTRWVLVDEPNWNTFVGLNAGCSSTTGNANTFIGYYAGSDCTTGSSNTFIGRNAGHKNKSGFDNTFLGDGAGYDCNSSFSSTFVGKNAGFYSTSGSYNTFIGTAAGMNSNGNNNTFIGVQAGWECDTGSNNTFLGFGGGYKCETGSDNTFLGQYAGLNNNGNGNVFIGNNAGFNEAGSDKLYIANSSTNPPLIYGDFSMHRLGINTTAPAEQFHVKGPGYLQAIFESTNSAGGIKLTSSDANEFELQALNDGGFIIYDRTDNRYCLKIDTDGNVGIGTTSPVAKLTVDGAILRNGSTIHGSYGYTHINLGMESTTGESGANHACATVGGGSQNTASGRSATVSGGCENTASGERATVGGGEDNIASNFYDTVGGGFENTAGGGRSTVSGGWDNTASNNYSTVAGGFANTASGDASTVAGGRVNTASGAYSVICGGFGNIAGGDYSFASGRRAKAYHDGSVVWADSTDEDFASTGNNQFLIRASGGVGIGTAAPETKLDISDGIRIQGLNYGYGVYPSTGAGMEIFYRPSDNTGLIQIYDRDANSAQAWGNLYLGNGNVGIATQSPGSYKLAVNGDAAKPGGGSWSNFSDGRLKKVGEGFERGLSDIIKLNPVRYSYRDDNELNLPTDKEFVGLVAQEVRDVVPEAIEENENGYLMVNNDPIIWTMLNAIKELKAENESLKEKLKTQSLQVQQKLEVLEKMIQQKR